MSRTRILLVDNDISFRDTVKEFLELRGYEVIAANNAMDAIALLKNSSPALIIIDIRLINDEDEDDLSGLNLAERIDSAMPKIILTGYPAYEDVRKMLSPGPDGKSIASGFIAKEEGLQKLLTAIRLALAQLPPTLQNHVLEEFHAQALPAIREQLAELPVHESILRMQTAVEKTTAELQPLREEARQRAAQLHKFGLVAKTVALALLTIAIVMLFIDATNEGVVSAVASALAEFINLLCSKQEKQAHKCAEELHEELRETEQDKHLMLLCEAVENPQDRDEYRKKVIDHILVRRAA
jgi:DNA-binding NarL/FixJ family response regulator